MSASLASYKFIVFSFAACLAISVHADAPNTFPGLSFGSKNGNFVGYTGKNWDNDFGVLSGECNVQAILALAQNPGTENAVAKIMVETTYRNIFPNTAEALEQTIDSNCFGHTLELVPTGKSVHWKNPETGFDVYITPGGKSDTCRTYTGITIMNGKKNRIKGEACSIRKGVWQFQR